MDTRTTILSAIFILAILAGTHAATFRSGNEESVTEAVNDNLYIAGGTININAVIRGDLVAAGGSVSVNDTVFEDLTAAGGEVLVNAFIGDDARVFGQNVRVMHTVEGDLIAGGSMVQVGGDAIVHGDLVVYGGYVVLDGTVTGNVKVAGGRVVINGTVNGWVEVRAGELSINGTVQGTSSLAANKITLGDDARFHDAVEYWQEAGTMEFGDRMVNSRAMFNEALELDTGEVEWEYLGLGVIVFWILYTLSVFLTIVLLVLLFGKTFSAAGERINSAYMRNFGYGVLYFIGIPLLALFFFATIIGIPIGLVLITLFGLSLLFAYSVTSVVVAYGLRFRYSKGWEAWKVMLVAALVFLVLKVLSVIPFLGILVAMVVISVAFGALILPCLPWDSASKERETAS